MQTTIYIISLFLLLPIFSCWQCDTPQKYTYFSYNALSKRDTMPDMFTQVSSQLPKHNLTYISQKQSDNRIYKLTNIAPHLYYNQHLQVQKFASENSVYVKLGPIELVLVMRYQITEGAVNSTGQLIAKVQMDDGSYFIKQLFSQDGELQWNPTQITQLTSTHLLVIEQQQPKLPLDDKLLIEKLLMDNLNSTTKVHEQILKDINQKYRSDLKLHLNKQNLLPDGEVIYQYKIPSSSTNKTLTFKYGCIHKNYTISQNNSKGIYIPFFFELANDTSNCTTTQFQFAEKDLGGLQQAISITTISNTFKQALKDGLYDITIGKDWQIPTWQFYMGDLANLISHAYEYPPSEQFTLKCEWDKNQSSVFILQNSINQIYSEAAQICKVIFRNQQKISFHFKISLIARAIAEEQYIRFQLSNYFKNTVTFTEIDPKFKVTNIEMANWVIKEVLTELIGHETFGTGWKITKRRFPSTFMTRDYLLIFDASEK